MASQSIQPTRRTVVRGAAWSVPVVAVAAAAPAFAASPCVLRSAVVSTSTAASPANQPAVQGWSRTNDTSGSWRTADPDGAATLYTNARIAVSQTRTSTNIEYGFTAPADNLVAPWTASTVTGLTINQRPTNTNVARGPDNRTITKFDFQRLVYGLTFTIADVSKSGSLTGSIGFWDAVWIESDGAFNITFLGTDVTGAGTQANPFTATDTASDTDNSATSNTTIAFSTRATYVNIHYWSAQRRPLANDNGGGQGITISNMSMQLAPDGCV